jgi:iron complex outermembrane receptor protein
MVITPERLSGYVSSTSNTATRTSASILNIPFSLAVVNQSLLQDSMALRLEDTAMFVSGVRESSTNSGFDTDLRIRGFSTGGSNYLDGVLDNQKFEVRDMALVERVEILKGHSSVLYGSGSPGGTVNYVTKKPQAESAHRFSYQTGSYEFNRMVFDSTGAVTADKSLLYRVIAAGQLANDFRANINHDSLSIAPSLTWHYAPDGALNVGFEYQKQKQPYRFDNVFTNNQVIYDHSYADSRNHSDRQYWRLSAAVQQKITDNWSWHFASNYFHVERDDLLFGFYTFVKPNTLSGYYRAIHDHYDQYSLRSEIHGQFDLFGSKHQLVSGIERNASDDRFRSRERIGGFTLDVYNPVFNASVPSSTRSDKGAKQTEYGFYLNDQIDITRFVHLTGGLRYSLFTTNNSKNDNSVAGTDQKALAFNAGVSVTPVDNIAGYFGYSQSFQPNVGTDKNLKFLPAKQGELFEFGIKSTWFEKRLNVSSAVYQLTQTNLSNRDLANVGFFVADGTVRGRGFELDINGKITDELQIVGNYSYMDTKFIQSDTYQGNTFRSSPRNSGTLWLNYALPIQHLTLGGGAVFAGRSYGDDANSFVIPSYIRGDLTARYQIEPFDFRFKLENLFDKRYVSSAVYDDTVIQGNRRTALFLIAVGF